ncbi:hypothetical protein, partial [Candidatus Clavichlamydia salmonicola]|uniref:hypothetical protein n=1 Tax=Candidatus Clavichlamydia salmonicola TaxID=469812 RepID=UPI001E4768E7
MPRTPQAAFSNFKRNLGTLYQGARLVTSCFLGMYGLFVAARCYDESCESRISSLDMVTPTLNSTSICFLDNSRIQCLATGFFYGVAGSVYLSVMLAEDVIVPRHLKRSYYHSMAVSRELFYSVPIIMAGSLSIVYGLIYLPVCMLVGENYRDKNKTMPCAVAHIVGMVSGGMYLVDAGMIFCDMLFENLNIDDAAHQDETRVVMLPPLEEAGPEVVGDVIQQDPDYSLDHIEVFLEGPQDLSDDEQGSIRDPYLDGIEVLSEGPQDLSDDEEGSIQDPYLDGIEVLSEGPQDLSDDEEGSIRDPYLDGIEVLSEGPQDLSDDEEGSIQDPYLDGIEVFSEGPQDLSDDEEGSIQDPYLDGIEVFSE